MIHKQGGGNRLVMVGIKGYKAHCCSSHQKCVVLSYTFKQQANIHDSKMASINCFENIKIEMSVFVQMLRMIVAHIYEIARTCAF